MRGAGCTSFYLDLALVGRALLSKDLIQLSGDGRGCAPSLVVVWPEATQPWGLLLYGRVNGELQEGLCQGAPSSAPCTLW